MESAAGCLGVAQECLGARQGFPAFQPCNGGLARPHTRSKFGLRETSAQPRFEEFSGNLELWSECIILGFNIGVGQETSLEFLEGNCHVIAFARRSASSISARGVF